MTADCNCFLHQFSKEDRAEIIDRAIDETIAEARANGGVLPIETLLDDLTVEGAERIRQNLEEA